MEAHKSPSSIKITQCLSDGDVTTSSHFKASNCSNATPTTKMLLQKTREKKRKKYERRGKMKVNGREMF
jgi:hypothetical protein